MELLVATLAYTAPGRDADVLARVRLISDTVRNTPGLITSRFYRSRGNESYYFILTTWEDEESWQRAQERHNPKKLLLTSAQSLLKAQPEQWLMRYLWGYSRPAAPPMLAGAYMATLRPEQVEFAQRGWINRLRQQAIQPPLAFAFLARGVREETLPPTNNALPNTPGLTDPPYHLGSVFLNLFSWASETEREQFFVDPSYQIINQFVSSAGAVHMLPLEQM
jgi:quinol monooxygenase YgiN